MDTGKYADFVILNDNPLDETVQLSDELVEMTVVGGEVVFKK